MAAAEFRKNNHYLSQSYLKHWESSPNKVFVYRRLVSHENVPIWKEESIEKFAYQEHLYTRRSKGIESDEMENWFANEFESPAESCIQNVVNGDRLNPDDWCKLVRFLALHDLTTPARFIEHFERTEQFAQEHLGKLQKELPIELGKPQNKFEGVKNVENAAFPLKISVHNTKEEDEFVTIKIETAVGRKTWLHTIKHQLEDIVPKLYRHKWTIMHPAKRMSWITSDKPVIRLNLHDRWRYDFRGGWDNKGSEILMPLSPEHMLYTCVGQKPPQRGTRFSIEQTKILRRMFAEHAHMYVLAKNADDEVPSFMPRHIDAHIFKQEKDRWKKWHSEQTELEDFF